VSSLILARHATTQASASGRNLGRAADPPLTDAGLALAQRLGLMIAAELRHLPSDELRLVSSPALRCRQTAAGVAAAVGIEAAPIDQDAGLLEIDYGAWDGLTPAECHDRDPQLRVAWEEDPFATACPDGESGRDVAARSLPVLGDLEAWARADRARCVIAVAHNHVNRIRLTDLLGLPMRDYRRRVSQDPAGYNLIALGSGAPHLRRLNAAPESAAAPILLNR
jgi:broad specificity phosphatase PhoE